MKCTWRRPAKQLLEPTNSSSPVTRLNSLKPANACRKIKKSCLPFTTSRPNIGRIYGPPTPSNQPSLPFGFELIEPREVLQHCSHALVGWPDAPPGLFGLWSFQSGGNLNRR